MHADRKFAPLGKCFHTFPTRHEQEASSSRGIAGSNKCIGTSNDGITASGKKLLVARCLATSSKDATATSSKVPYYQ